jgi:hypothetical protein
VDYVAQLSRDAAFEAAGVMAGLTRPGITPGAVTS